MKPRHIVLGAALVLAAGLVLFGDSTPDAGLAEPVERPAAARTIVPPAGKPGEEVAIGRLVPRETLIGAAGERFGQDGIALFARQDWTPPPPPATEAPPPPPPSAPPLPFTYVGKSLQDGVWEIYLARGERSYLVRDGATIDNTYRVETIRPPVLTLTYLPLGQSQQLNIGVFD